MLIRRKSLLKFPCLIISLGNIIMQFHLSVFFFFAHFKPNGWNDILRELDFKTGQTFLKLLKQKSLRLNVENTFSCSQSSLSKISRKFIEHKSNYLRFGRFPGTAACQDPTLLKYFLNCDRKHLILRILNGRSHSRPTCQIEGYSTD